MQLENRDQQFIIVGENIHTTRIVLRKGKLVTTAPDGSEAVRYTAADGSTRYLVIPDHIKQTKDYDEGSVKHIKIAVLDAMAGKEPAAAEGIEYIRALVHRQLKAGADFLDLNVDEISLRLEDQKEAMRWLVRTVEAMSPVPLSIDSSNMEIIEVGLAACEGRAGRALLNSASLERVEALQFAKSRNLPVIVTAAGQKGMPEDDEQRVVNASQMVDAAVANGIALRDIYVDALVFPIAVDSRFGNHCLDAFRRLRQKYGAEIHITGGLSNVSFGLPCRRLLNDVWINLAVAAGADSGIVDPVATDVRRIMSIDTQNPQYRLAEDVLLGRDRNCKNFLKAYRKGRAASGYGLKGWEMARYQVLYWKNVPAQVKVFPESGRPLARQMPDRFQTEIDRIAMEQGLAGTDDYLNQWRWTAKQERPGDPAEVMDALIRELEKDWDTGGSQ